MSEGLIGVLIGGAITFLSGFFIENRKQKKDEIKFRREKLETLYFNYSKWEKYIITVHMYITSCQYGKITVETFSEKIKNNEMNDIYTEILTIINLYFDNLKDSYHSLNKAKENLISYSKHENLNQDKIKREDLFSNFKEKSDEFKKAIADEVQRIEKSC